MDSKALATSPIRSTIWVAIAALADAVPALTWNELADASESDTRPEGAVAPSPPLGQEGQRQPIGAPHARWTAAPSTGSESRCEGQG